MAYTFSVNNTPSSGTVAIWAVITTLKSVGWSQLDSGDGITAGHGDGYVTGSGSGAGGLGNTGAWVRLRAPAVNGGAVANQTREVLFQRGTTETAWRLKYSASAGFTGGSPSSTVSATAADQVIMMGSGTDASPGYSTFFGSAGTYRWHICCGGAAEFYSFYVLGLLAGQRMLNSSYKIAIYMDVLAAGSYPPEDVDPCVFYCSLPWASAGGTDGFGNSSWFAGSTLNALVTVTNPALMRAWMGPTSQADGYTNTNSVAVIMAGAANYFGSSGWDRSFLGQNSFTKKDAAIPALYIRFSSSTPPFGPKGFSTLFKMASAQRYAFNLISVNTARDRLHFGMGGGSGLNGVLFWLPWNGSLPLI